MSRHKIHSNLRRFSVNVPRMDQDRLQGWLTVANAIESDSLDQLDWKRRYCVLDKSERKLHFFNDTEAVLAAPPLSPDRFKVADEQDGSSLSTQRKNALTLLDPAFSGFQRGTRQTRSFREKVKSSLQKSVKRNSKQENFAAVQGGSVRVGRSRSFGKVDKIDQSATLGLPGLKLGHSLENLHRVGSHGSPDTRYSTLGENGTFLDLAMRGTLSILPVHQSVSPRHSCFRIVTDSDILYASCGSQEELEKWLSNLSNCQRPNRNLRRRLDTQLSLWVMEARNVVPKKRYYCEIYLNGILYAQTCCKMMNDILFWGEPFLFNDLPPLGAVMIKLYRENYNKKKREKVPATDIGKIEIPALILENGQNYEKWYPLTTYSSVKGGGGTGKERERDTPSVRVKLHYHVVSILQLKMYDDFLKFLKTDYRVVCEVLEPHISAKAKDEIAQTLVRILQVAGKAKELLCDIVMAEVEHTENENLIFRGNTFATKAVDTYMKMVGDTYLRETLTPFICVLLESEEECEVDPTRLLPNTNVQHNQAALTRLVKKAWHDILSSYTKFPSDLRNTLYGLRQRFGAEREDACFKLISGSIFLRFLCPAILSPSLFQLCQEYPGERTSRKLTLVAKVIQNLANFARFGVKEEYMCFMNDFVEEEIKNMKEFINRISSPLSASDPVISWGPYHIDLGREASIMHQTLSTQIKSLKLSEDTLHKIHPLLTLLDQLSKTGEEEEGDPFSSTFEALRIMQTTINKFNVPGPTDEISDSSSEYTTPAQSQPTSPSNEQSPPPPAILAQTTQATLGSAAAQLSTQTHSESTSPNTSPNHSVSRLATHKKMAAFSKPTIHTVPPDPGSPRRLSDTDLQRHRVRPRNGTPAMTYVPDYLRPSHSHSRSIDGSLTKFDDHLEVEELRATNGQLQEEIDRLKRQLVKIHQDAERDSERLRRAEEAKRKSEQELKGLRDSRGKILRGLNTQTEIALVQFKRDFEHLKKQLQAKDEIIAVQERKIASMIEANCTLRKGLEELQGIPKHEEDSESDLEEEVQHRLQSSKDARLLMNGHGSEEGPPVMDELMQVITQLDSGKFEI